MLRLPQVADVRCHASTCSIAILGWPAYAHAGKWSRLRAITSVDQAQPRGAGVANLEHPRRRFFCRGGLDAERNRKFADSPLEETGFELSVPSGERGRSFTVARETRVPQKSIKSDPYICH